MAPKVQPKLSGYLLIAAGILFFGAAFTGRQHAFTGLGVVFLILGIAALRRAKQAG